MEEVAFCPLKTSTFLSDYMVSQLRRRLSNVRCVSWKLAPEIRGRRLTFCCGLRLGTVFCTKQVAGGRAHGGLS
jgi:hypothetical protein